MSYLSDFQLKTRVNYTCFFLFIIEYIESFIEDHNNPLVFFFWCIQAVGGTAKTLIEKSLSNFIWT